MPLILATADMLVTMTDKITIEKLCGLENYASMQFDHLSLIWNTSLDDYSSVTNYCSALEIVVSNFAASGPAEFPQFNSHVLALIALMGLPPSYKSPNITSCLRWGQDA